MLCAYIFLSVNFIVGSDMSIDSLIEKPILQAVIFKRLHKLNEGLYEIQHPIVPLGEIIGKPLEEFNSRGDLVGILHAFSYSDGTMIRVVHLPSGKNLKITRLHEHLGGLCEFKDAQGKISCFSF